MSVDLSLTVRVCLQTLRHITKNNSLPTVLKGGGNRVVKLGSLSAGTPIYFVINNGLDGQYGCDATFVRWRVTQVMPSTKRLTYTDSTVLSVKRTGSVVTFTKDGTTFATCAKALVGDVTADSALNQRGLGAKYGLQGLAVAHWIGKSQLSCRAAVGPGHAPFGPSSHQAMSVT